jgi:hypothetical protein
MPALAFVDADDSPLAVRRVRVVASRARTVAFLLQARLLAACSRAHALVMTATDACARADDVARGCAHFLLSPADRSAARVRRPRTRRRRAAARSLKDEPIRIRVILDARRIEWRVREIDAEDVPGARGPRSLVFENHAAVRRLWRYPPDWHLLPDEALLVLLDTRPA